MKKTLIAILVLSCLSANAAEYQARYNINSITGSVPFEPIEKWNDLPTVYGNWTNSGSPTDCTTKTPLEETINVGVSFTQNLSGCKQQQVRTVRTDQISSKGVTKTGVTTNESQTLNNYSYTIQSVGTKALETFTDLPTVYTNWANVGVATNCTKTPLENTIDNNTQFTQTLSNCTQQQQRTARTDQQGSYGTVKTGQVITETKTLTDYSYTIQATGTKPVADCNYSATPATATRWYDVAQSKSATTNYGYAIQWNGTMITNTINSSSSRPKVNSFTAGGYVYTRGTFNNSSEYNASLGLSYHLYQACREPVKP